jgi:hypothetical protein
MSPQRELSFELRRLLLHGSYLKVYQYHAKLYILHKCNLLEQSKAQCELSEQIFWNIHGQQSIDVLSEKLIIRWLLF